MTVAQVGGQFTSVLRFTKDTMDLKKGVEKIDCVQKLINVAHSI